MLAPRPPRPGIGLQNLLLGLGTALVAIAAIVFTAVNWDRMGASAQGLVLLACTGIAVGATVLAARRSMPATAEALGLASLMLALADVHALRIGVAPTADVSTFWAAGLAVVALLGWALGTELDVRSTRAAAALLIQLPLLLLLDHLAHAPNIEAFLVLVQSAVVFHLAITPRPAPRLVRVVAAATGLVIATGGTLGGLATMLDSSPSDRMAPAAVLAFAAAVVASILARRPDDDVFGQPGLLVASGLTAVAVIGGLSALAAGDAYFVALSAIAVGLVAIAAHVPARWGVVPGGTAAVVGAGAALPILGHSLVLALAAALEPTDGSSTAGLAAADRASDLVDHLGSLPPTWALAAQLLVLALAVGAVGHRLGRLVTERGLLAVGAITVVVAPLLAPLSIGGMVALALSVAAAAVVVATVGTRSPVRVGSLAGFALGVGALGLCWAAVTEATWMAGLGVAIAVAVGAVYAGRRAGAMAVAVPAVVIGTGLMAAEASAVAIARGATDLRSLVIASIAGLVVGLVTGLLADPEGRERGPDALLGIVAEGSGWVLHLLALVAVAGSPTTFDLSLVLSAGAMAAGLHAARAGRRGLAAVAVAECIVLSWVQLGSAGVTTVEAYTLPIALVLLAAGLYAARRVPSGHHNLPSWVVEGPALVVAFAPTVLVAWQDPGLVRPLVGLAAGAIVLSFGAWTGRRAPVDVGVAVVVALGLRQLGPVVGGLPNWATIGASGVLLLAVGATFEQRRRDLEGVRNRYSALT